MTNPLTILAIFAHPDDEIGSGSTLARYGDAGVRTVLVCATRGEAATIYCDDCALPDTLAVVRTRELECACGHLGIRELRWLDWPDGGVKELPRVEAMGQIVRQIREVKPEIIITHPEHGLYPHPDHLAIWEMVREAFTLAADPAEYPEAGPAWAAARLFTRAIPQSVFDAAPSFAQYRVQLNGQQLPFVATPDDQVDVSMQVAAWTERRWAAWDCHRSQHNPEGAFSQVPADVRRAMVETEHFVLSASRSPLPEGVTDDLLAGLDPQSAMFVPQMGSAAELAAHIAALRGALAASRAQAEVLLAYLRGSPELKQAQLYRRLGDSTQEIIYRLAHALRVAGEPASTVEADAKLRQRGRYQASGPERIAYLRNLTEGATSRFQAQARRAATSYQKAVWEELVALAQEEAAAVAAFA